MQCFANAVLGQRFKNAFQTTEVLPGLAAVKQNTEVKILLRKRFAVLTALLSPAENLTQLKNTEAVKITFIVLCRKQEPR